MKKVLFLFTLFFMVIQGNSQTKTDVWDFGGVELDANLYNNKLTISTINSWYSAGTIAGSTGKTLLSSTELTLTAGELKLKTGNNDRLYVSTNNPNYASITRYADNNTGTTDTNYTARYYCNGNASSTTRFFTLTLNADDEVTVVASTENGSFPLSIVNITTNNQTESIPVVQSGTNVTLAKFVAKEAGDFKISSLLGKGNYYRIYRKPATFVSFSGTVDTSNASNIPSSYSLQFKNDFSGKTWIVPVNSNLYTANLPAGYTYSVSLVNANGYILTAGKSLNLTTSTTTHDLAALAVDLKTVTGSISGLGTKISSLALTYTADPAANKVYIPIPTINTANSTYSVDLETNTNYTITSIGVNDFQLDSNTINVSDNTTSNINFSAKPLYGVTINTTGIDATQLSKLNLTFANVNEPGYSYSFTPGSSISLRDGTYTVSYSGLNDYSIVAKPIANLKVNGAAISKNIDFIPVKVWSFNDQSILTSTTSYKGLILGGTAASINNEQAKGHLLVKTGGTVKIPVNPNDVVSIDYYYSANFSIDGGSAITTSSGSTTLIENTTYEYTGSTAGYITLTAGGTAYTTYLTEIRIGTRVPFSSTLSVGADKPYKTINSALAAVALMPRSSSDRVTILVDPGNYEEMIEITQPNITIKNASSSPSLAISNKGVDIDANAVRITSYYGNGYNYYSMNNQKWDLDTLLANKENGSPSYINQSGTTNNSYWNATLIVGANGFTAENIIIENSYNQYISKKESEDIVVEVPGVGKGTRPTTVGSTAVQNRSYVERAAAIAIKNNIDKTILNNCRVIGRQDSFFGGTNSRVAIYKGIMMGAVDYIYGGMNATFYKTELQMNTSDVSSDSAYLTAAQQSSGRGYLMYECKVTSTTPGVETASIYRAKPGYFGRPWAANTSEVVFYNTTVETSNYPGSEGISLISPAGWSNSLSGESNKMYEFGTIENSGVNNSANRAAWSTVLSTPVLTDGTAITPFNFTKGTDNWDPFSELIANDNLSVNNAAKVSSVRVFSDNDNVFVTNVKSNTNVKIYNLSGMLIKSFSTNRDINFSLPKGLWIVNIKALDGQKSVKLFTK